MTFRSASPVPPNHVAATSFPRDSATAEPRFGVILAAVIALAVVIRLTCFVISSADPASRQMEEDSRGYLALAENLSQGKGFGRLVNAGPSGEAVWVPEICRTPGYPVVAAFLGIVTGHTRAATILMQHGAMIALCVVLALVCRKAWGAWAGILAAAFLAVDLQGVALGNLLLAEACFGILVCLGALGCAALLRRSSIGLALGVGLLFGLSALVRPTGLALPALVAVAFAVYAWLKRDLRFVAYGVCIGLAGMAPVAGWILRNQVVCGEATLSSVWRYNLVFNYAVPSLALDKGITEAQAQQEILSRLQIGPGKMRYLPLSPEETARLRHVAYGTVWDHRYGFLRKTVREGAMMLLGPEKQILAVLGLPWVKFTGPNATRPSDYGCVTWMLLGWQVLLMLGLYALVLLALWRSLLHRHGGPLLWVCLGFAVYLVATSVSLPDTRFRWPALPLLAIIAASALRRGARSAPCHQGN